MADIVLTAGKLTAGAIRVGSEPIPSIPEGSVSILDV